MAFGRRRATASKKILLIVPGGGRGPPRAYVSVAITNQEDEYATRAGTRSECLDKRLQTHASARSPNQSRPTALARARALDVQRSRFHPSCLLLTAVLNRQPTRSASYRRAQSLPREIPACSEPESP